MKHKVNFEAAGLKTELAISYTECSSKDAIYPLIGERRDEFEYFQIASSRIWIRIAMSIF